MTSTPTAAQSAFVVLGLLFGVAGFSLAVSARAIPPRFRSARRQVWLLSGTSFAVSVTFLTSVVWP